MPGAIPLIQRGRGNGPLKPRQPSRRPRGHRWGRCQFRLVTRPRARKMRRKGLASMAAQTVASTDSAEASTASSGVPDTAAPFGPAAALSCRECGTRVPLEPGLRVSGVLRTARSGLRPPAGRPRGPAQADRGRPDQHLALRPAAAGPRRRRGPAEPQPRLDQARQGRQPGPRTGHHRRPARQGRLRQPDPLLQGPGRRHRPGGRPHLRPHHAVLLLHRQPGRRGRRRRGPRGPALVRVHPARPGGRQGRHGRGLRRRTGRHRGHRTTT